MGKSESRLCYLDNNATTRVAPEVVAEMLPFFTERYGNASSMHQFGGAVHSDVQKARERVASFLDAQTPAEIVFTSCGSESDNQAIFGVVEALGESTVVITSAVEHPAVLQPCKRLEERGHTVVRVGVHGNGTLRMDEYAAALALPGPKLVTLMWANNETGVLFPIVECARMAKAVGAVFHTDATQAVGKVPISVRNSDIDLLTFSGHKIHAPKGIGVLYIRRGTPIRPFLLGGHQEQSRRAGTENVPYIVGLGKAVELAGSELRSGELDRIRALRDRLQSGLSEIPDTVVNGSLEFRLPNTLNVSFPYIEGEAILYHLSDAGICASSGSACTSGSLEPSHVLRAMKVPFTSLHGSVRFSFSRYNTDEDVQQVLSVMPGIVRTLRALSPFGH